MILGKKVRTIKKKENSTECIFWENNTKTCAIYKNRPFDRMMYPFDIFRINEKYHWVVYSCKPKSNWEWSETYLQMLESSPQFREILENIDIFSNLDEINRLKKLDELPYVVLRPVTFSKILNNLR